MVIILRARVALMKFLISIHSFIKHPSFSFILNGIGFLGMLSYVIWLTFYLYICIAKHNCYITGYVDDYSSQMFTLDHTYSLIILSTLIIIGIPLTLSLSFHQFRIAYSLWKSVEADNSKENY